MVLKSRIPSTPSGQEQTKYNLSLNPEYHFTYSEFSSRTCRSVKVSASCGLAKVHQRRFTGVKARTLPASRLILYARLIGFVRNDLSGTTPQEQRRGLTYSRTIPIHGRFRSSGRVHRCRQRKSR